MYLYPSYAVTPDREALGVIDAGMLSRLEVGAPAPVESRRWIEGYARVAEQANALSQSRRVC
jgi:hypothetical protein